ncbi:hypothetical protein ScPMuIL_012134 [Solemya velum]
MDLTDQEIQDGATKVPVDRVEDNIGKIDAAGDKGINSESLIGNGLFMEDGDGENVSGTSENREISPQNSVENEEEGQMRISAVSSLAVEIDNNKEVQSENMESEPPVLQVENDSSAEVTREISLTAIKSDSQKLDPHNDNCQPPELLTETDGSAELEASSLTVEASDIQQLDESEFPILQSENVSPLPVESEDSQQLDLGMEQPDSPVLQTKNDDGTENTDMHSNMAGISSKENDIILEEVNSDEEREIRKSNEEKNEQTDLMAEGSNEEEAIEDIARKTKNKNETSEGNKQISDDNSQMLQSVAEGDENKHLDDPEQEDIQILSADGEGDENKHLDDPEQEDIQVVSANSAGVPGDQDVVVEADKEANLNQDKKISLDDNDDQSETNGDITDKQSISKPSVAMDTTDLEPLTDRAEDDLLKATEDVPERNYEDVNEDDLLGDNEESMDDKTSGQEIQADKKADIFMEIDETADKTTTDIGNEEHHTESPQVSDSNVKEGSAVEEMGEEKDDDSNTQGISQTKIVEEITPDFISVTEPIDVIPELADLKSDNKEGTSDQSAESVKEVDSKQLDDEPMNTDHMEMETIDETSQAKSPNKDNFKSGEMSEIINQEEKGAVAMETDQDEKEKERKMEKSEKDEDQEADDIKIIDVVTPNDKPKEIINLDDDDDDDDETQTDKDGGNKDNEMNLKISSVTSGKEATREADASSKESKQSTSQPKAPNTPSKTQKCIVCARVGKCKYNIVRNGDIKHLCDDVCFKRFRNSPTTFLRASSPARSKEPPGPSLASTSAPTLPPTSTPASALAPVTAPIPASKVQSSAKGNNQQPEGNKQHTTPPQFKTCSVCQLMNVNTSKPFLNWLGLDFCREECLGKFQSDLKSSCAFCAGSISAANKAKFCSKVGTEVKGFCSNACYNEFKKKQKVCSFCQKDLSSAPDSFMAPVGPQGTFKDFCTQVCLQNYEEKSNKDIEITGVDRALKSKILPEGDFTCAVCSKVGPAKHEIKLEKKLNRLCSDPCLSAFQYANKLTMNTCDNCGVYCYYEGTQPQYIQYEGHQKRFCSFMCINTFKSLNKKIIPCAWCGSKKSNFDMIERVDQSNKYQLFCSLNCLSLYRVNLQATSNQAITCDHCRKFVPAQYHLTMSDASVRNFCSYSCVMSFQGQFAGGGKGGAAQKQQTPPQKTPTSQPRQVAPQQRQAPVQQKPVQQPPSASKTSPSIQKYGTRSSTRYAQQATSPNITVSSSGSIPIISNVVSLAPQTKGGAPQSQTVNLKTTTSVPVIVSTQSQSIKTTAPVTTQTSVQQQIIIQPPPPKTVKNKSLLCKPFVQTKATSCRPHTQSKSVQTEGDTEPKKYFIPVPVPIYIPVPMAMYTMPTPFPLPVPVPIGVPCFIPTTRKSAKGISKSIKEILEKIPSDPLEAELLMMAEAVASAPKKTDSDSSDDDDDEKDTAAASEAEADEALPQSGVAEGGNEFGEDMLQMALRMASEMDTEPVMDLETSLAPVPVNTEPPQKDKPEVAAPTQSAGESDDDYVPTRETRSKGRGTKRQSSGRGGRKNKRAKIEPKPSIAENSPSPATTPPPPVLLADANMCLKYTYGVNAWKHWVVQKNAQLEKVTKSGSNKLKLFKTELLQCSADELNYSLCLFVKEVRKPNGEEYAPDSIFYLCLGIQMYIFENGRVDNIFTDTYYEKYTECLNEVLSRYEPKINTAGNLVCRIEEEQLWESKQLGAHSPHVLLNTLVYFNTKFFMLKTTEDHIKLSFTHIMKHFKKSTSTKTSSTTGNRSVYLRYFCPANKGNKKKGEGMPVYEQAENLDNPLRCPVKLYEFYLSKCPDSTKNRNDTFYMAPERSCVPDSPVWYSTQPLSNEAMTKMLNRIRLVKEIQEAHLHTQPIFI